MPQIAHGCFRLRALQSDPTTRRAAASPAVSVLYVSAPHGVLGTRQRGHAWRGQAIKRGRLSHYEEFPYFHLAYP
jgi:hypothetical protein